eukprot:3343839-Pleurochrysis_carterae.AAC.5
MRATASLRLPAALPPEIDSASWCMLYKAILFATRLHPYGDALKDIPLSIVIYNRTAWGFSAASLQRTSTPFCNHARLHLACICKCYYSGIWTGVRAAIRGGQGEASRSTTRLATDR